MIKKIILSILSAGMILAAMTFGWLIYEIQVPAQNTGKLNVDVKANSSAGDLAGLLKQAGVIRSIWAYKFYARWSGADRRLIPGSHEIAPHSNIPAVLKQLASKIINEREITVIEGWRLEDIADSLASANIDSREDFISVAQIDNWRAQYEYLHDPRIKSLEGFLFPDTYRIYLDAKPQDIIKRMLDNFNQKVTAEMTAQLLAQNRNLFETFILASIIEREALYDEDRAMIADIFLKRLDDNIGLQSDATINYITGKKTTRPTFNDLQVDSPYNTYKYRGLPPGPICNPGLASLKAAVYPQVNDYYYFLTDRDGRAHFGRTYAEHQQNIARYLNN